MPRGTLWAWTSMGMGLLVSARAAQSRIQQQRPCWSRDSGSSRTTTPIGPSAAATALAAAAPRDDAALAGALRAERVQRDGASSSVIASMSGTRRRSASRSRRTCR